MLKGLFVKGHKPWNEGVETGLAPRSVFKKGNTPWNKGKKGLQVGHNRIERVTLICQNCGEKYRVELRRQSKSKYCSKKCYGNSRIGTRGYWFGKKRPPESRLKMKLARLKNPVRYWLGKHHSAETKNKVSIGRLKSPKNRGENHYNWQDGKSFEPYGLEFCQNLKEQIRKRDRYQCQECFRHQDELFTKGGRRYKLAIHHIDYDKTNNSPNNLISLCRSCHTQTNFTREDWTKYYKERNFNICQ